MKQLKDIFWGKRVLVTGHTGFKGSWLCLWLNEWEAEVTGISLSPESHPNHWDLLNLDIDDHRLDIRDYGDVLDVFMKREPEIVFHLAAQPLVRRSYQDPLETWSSNLMGTAHILEACRHTPSVRAIVVVTTDKCYENQEWPWGYRENDRLGGHDPYSASKAGAELIASSYRSAFFKENNGPLLATARAGNVIGGGDWAIDRLIPDAVRAIENNDTLAIRSPNAKRPWQHVLESLNGYLLLGGRLLQGDAQAAQAWNFGPDTNGNLPVSRILDILKIHWPQLSWNHLTDVNVHESNLLHLDSSKARAYLGWKSVWDLETTIRMTSQWYSEWMEHQHVVSRDQLLAFISTQMKSDEV